MRAAFMAAVRSWIALRHALVSGDDPAIVMQGRDRVHGVRDLAALYRIVTD